MAATAAAAGGTADLLALQSSIKRDPEGYRDEFLLQYRHYRATLDLFMLRPAAAGAAAAGGADGNGADGDGSGNAKAGGGGSASAQGSAADAGGSRQLAELATFVAHVSRCFPAETAGFAVEVAALLEARHAALDPALRRALVKALVLLRNRGQLSPSALLPLLFRLFRVEDRALRELLHRHIVADVRASNAKTRNERLNRQLQSYLYGVLQQQQQPRGGGGGGGGGDGGSGGNNSNGGAGGNNGGGGGSSAADEAAAKRALAVLTELWRRGVWRDARCVNVIASAVFHPSGRVMLGALRFFLGEDERAAEADRDDEDEDDENERDEEKRKNRASDRASAAAAAVQPSKEDVYKAMKKGTVSSKKKKQAKLKRVMTSLRKQARREEAAASGGGGGSGGGAGGGGGAGAYAGVGAGGVSAKGSGGAFAALHLLHDPQAFAERLFARLQACRERWETRLAALAVLSRCVGAHRLLLPNLYPWLMRYAQPHARDSAQVLAALAQACHDLVPPEALRPVLRGLADNFVSDRSRPEAMVAGLRAVREVSLRCPLAMDAALLADLAEYRRHRGDREVGTAARALVALFRELHPGLLAKKDRGRAAALEAAANASAGGGGAPAYRAPAAYGSASVAARVAGADLLQADLERRARGGGSGSGDGEDRFDEEEDDEDYGLDLDSTESDELLEGMMAREDAQLGVGKAGEGSGEEEEEGESEEEEGSGSGSLEESGEQEDDDEDEDEDEDAEGEDDAPTGNKGEAAAARPAARAPQSGSLADLRRQLAAAAAAKKKSKEEEDEAAKKQQREEAGADGADGAGAADAGAGADAALPLEATRILTAEDFARIRALRRRQLVEGALARHGLAPADKDKAAGGDKNSKRGGPLQASRAKRRRLLEAAHAEADEALALEEARRRAGERRVDPASLEGRVKRRKDKAERLESVLAGREGREFGSRASLKKLKTGGLSERQKQKNKALPSAARTAQLRRRADEGRRRKSAKNFKGHVRGN